MRTLTHVRSRRSGESIGRMHSDGRHNVNKQKVSQPVVPSRAPSTAANRPCRCVSVANTWPPPPCSCCAHRPPDRPPTPPCAAPRRSEHQAADRNRQGCAPRRHAQPQPEQRDRQRRANPPGPTAGTAPYALTSMDEPTPAQRPPVGRFSRRPPRRQRRTRASPRRRTRVSGRRWAGALRGCPPWGARERPRAGSGRLGLLRLRFRSA